MGNSTSGCCKVIIDKEANGEPPPAVLEEPLFIPKHFPIPAPPKRETNDAGVQAAPQAHDWHHDAHLPHEDSDASSTRVRPRRSLQKDSARGAGDPSEALGLDGLDGLDDIVGRIYLFCYQHEVHECMYTCLCASRANSFSSIFLLRVHFTRCANHLDIFFESILVLSLVQTY
jgi:hypothetical protein